MAEQDTTPSFDDYIEYIDDEEPVGIMWDLFSEHPELEWHWTVGRGYFYDDLGNEIKLNDP